MAKNLNAVLGILVGGAAILGGTALAVAFAAPAALPPGRPEDEAESGGPGRPAPPAPDSAKAQTPRSSGPAVTGGAAGIAQAQIIGALWKVALEGDPSAVDDINLVAPQLSPELQVYFVAASQTLRQAFAADQQFRQSFLHEFDEANKKFEEFERDADLGLGAFAAAVNVIPIFGQAVSVLTGLAIGIKRAILAGLPPEQRKLEDNAHIFRDWEGGDCLRGLHIQGNSNPSPKELQAQIDMDLIARRLPSVQRATQFDYTPTVQQFRSAAQKAGLYGEAYLRAAYGFSTVWNIEPGDAVPTTAYEINSYSYWYTWGKNGGTYTGASRWGQIGYEDATAGRPMRMSGDVLLWADALVNP